MENTKKETAPSLSAAPEPLVLPENPAGMQETSSHDAEDSQMQDLQHVGFMQDSSDCSCRCIH